MRTLILAAYLATFPMMAAAASLTPRTAEDLNEVQNALQNAIEDLRVRLEKHAKGIQTSASEDMADRLRKSGLDDLNNIEGLLGIKVEVDSKSHDISLHLPSIAWKSKTLTFHYLKLVFVARTVKFKVPYLTWEIRRIGFLRTRVPVWRSRICVKTIKVPETRRVKKVLRFRMPTLRMIRRTIKFKLPQVRVIRVKRAMKKLETQSEEYAREIEKKSSRLDTWFQSELKKVFASFLPRFRAARSGLASKFDEAEREVTSAIAKMRDHGQSPKELEGQLEELRAQKCQALAEFDKAIENLTNQVGA